MIAQGRCHVKSTEDHYSMPPVSRQTKHHTFIDGGSSPRRAAAAAHDDAGSTLTGDRPSYAHAPSYPETP